MQISNVLNDLAKAMKALDGKNNTWCRPRNGGTWELIKDNVDSKAMVRLDNSWIDVIVFHHPPGVFDVSGRGGSIHERSCKVDPQQETTGCKG